MSVEQYEQMHGTARHRAMTQALASVRAEGLEPDADGLARLQAVADGHLSIDDALEQALAKHRNR